MMGNRWYEREEGPTLRWGYRVFVTGLIVLLLTVVLDETGVIPSDHWSYAIAIWTIAVGLMMVWD